MKKYKNSILLVVLLAVVVLIGKQYFSSKGSTLKTSSNEFNIKDTGSISKVFIADMKGNSVLLERGTNNQWMVNSKYKTVQHNINNLLETINLMTVKAPVSKARYNKTIADMSTLGTKVEVYQNGSTPSKTFYIGTTLSIQNVIL